jgi:hypothetical protein
MIWQFCQRPLLHAAISVGVTAWATAPSVADQAAYCVHCTGPDQTYVCKVEAGGGKASDALKLYCVVRAAKEGHHASCSAERNSPSCNGVEKVYSYDGPMPEDLASDPHVKKLTDKIESEQKAFDKPKGDGNAPKTLVELGGRAVNASRQGWRNARGVLSGSSGDQSLPAGEPLTQEEQNAAIAAQAAPPDPSLAAPHPNRMQRAYRCMMSLFRHCSSESAEGAPIR